MNSNISPPACDWQLKGEDRKSGVLYADNAAANFLARQMSAEFQWLIHETFSWILRWNHFVDRKYVVYTVHSTIHEDDNKLRLRQLNVNETWKISVLTVVLNKKPR
jgi:hypothetical protein